MNAIMRPITLSLVSVILLTGCRSVYYSMWEKMGKEKRDLLRSNVEKARDEQLEASEEFKDALTRLQELYQTGGTELDKQYRAFKKNYDRCEERAGEVRDRVAEVDQVAGDLFVEWEKEIEEISSASLRSKSREKLDGTRERYAGLHQKLKQAEEKMDPVLMRLQDQVLYLKHNLNAQAIGMLEGEFTSIENDIRDLITELNQSITEADAFIETLPE